MVAIFTGAGAGAERGSGNILGSAGLLGSGTLGRSGEQVSLNAATGNLLISKRDEFLVGDGPDATIARTYNSLGDLSDDNGDNWRQSTDRRVYGLIGTANSVGSTVMRVSGDGSQIVYAWDAARSLYVATDGAGAYDTLAYDGSAWKWTDGDSQVTESYAAYGADSWRITAQADPFGRALRFSYSGENLTSVATADGWGEQYIWSGGNIVEIDTASLPEPDATYATYVYNMYDAAFNRLPDWSGYPAYMSAFKAGMTMSQFGDIIYGSGEYQARGVGSMTNDAYVEFLYTSVLRHPSDAQGKASYVAQLNAGSLTRSNLLAVFANSAEHVAVAASLGRSAPAVTKITRTRYGYDASNRLTSVTVDLTPEDNAINDGRTYVTTYSYVGNSRQIDSISETDGSRLDVGYDGQGRVATLQQTVASGVVRQTTIAYGSGATTITDPLGQATTLAYNADGSLAQFTAPPAYVGAAAQTWRFAYNVTGDVTSVTDGLGAVSSFAYDGSGNVVRSTDPLGNVVTRTYGAKNELLTETRVGADAGSSAASHTVRYIYDSFDRLIYQISAEGRVTRNIYDQDTLYRTLDYVDSAYNVAALADTATPSSEDMDNWIAAMPDRTNTVNTEYYYDDHGNLYEVTKYSQSGPGIPNYGRGSVSDISYIYDQAGQLLSRTVNGLNTETFVYDGLGRVIASTDINGATTQIVFNDAATQTVVTLATGLVTTSTYDKTGNLLSVTDSGSDVAGGTARYAYDKEGRLRSSVDATGRWSYKVYDNAGRKVADVDHDGALVEYRYDADSRVVATIRYATRLTSAQLVALQDPASALDIAALRPAGTSDDLWAWTIYDAAGRTTEAIEGDGSVTQYSYDSSGKLTSTRSFANKLDALQLAALRASQETLAANLIDNSQFTGTTGWFLGYDPNHISSSDSPQASVIAGKATLSSSFTATAADQAISMDDRLFAVTAGETLWIQEGVEARGPVASLIMVVWWTDAQGKAIATWPVATLTGEQAFNTKMSGFAVAPAGAVQAAITLYLNTSGAGTGTFRITEPMVSQAGVTQAVAPAFTPTPPADSTRDSIARNFYDKDGLLIGVLDGEGYLSQIGYDNAGRKVRQTAYATATAQAQRGSGTFADLLATVGSSGTDRTARFVYDG